MLWVPLRVPFNFLQKVWGLGLEFTVSGRFPTVVETLSLARVFKHTIGLRVFRLQIPLCPYPDPREDLKSRSPDLGP